MHPLVLNKATQVYRLNELCNSPEITPYVAPGMCDIDMSGFFEQPFNVALFYGTGAVIFGALDMSLEGHTYEMHYLFPRSMRGRAALAACRDALRVMFTEHRARAILGKTPAGHRAARHFSAALGGIPQGTCVDGTGRDCIVYMLERATWATSSAALSAA